MGKLSPSKKKLIDFCEAYPECKMMLAKSAKAEGTKVHYSNGVKQFSEFIGKTPTEIVNEYKVDVQKSMYQAFDKWEIIFENFKVKLSEHYEASSVNSLLCGAKNLINCNVPRSARIQVKSPEVFSRSIPPITIDDLKEVYAMSTARERAIIAFLKDSGMSREDALRVNKGGLEGYEKGEQYVHLNVFRGKEKVEYETFIGPNAVEALKAYFTLRQKRGETLTPETPLFASEEKPYGRLDVKSVSTIFVRLSIKTGKTISTHRLRKFFETYMALTVRHPIVLKYWMGHKIGHGRDIEARYIIPPTPEQLKLYQESYRNIDLTGGTLEERAKQAAREEFEKMLTPEQREFVQKHGMRFQRRRKADLKESEDCENGEHCQRVVGEAELASLLSEGWHASLVLPSGKIVVSH